jgi:hypothetical protein
VKEVTPPQAVLLADEPTYFILRGTCRRPGLELADSHKLDFPPAMARDLHVIPQKESDRQIKAGVFDTIEISDDDTRVDTLGLRKMYAHSAEGGRLRYLLGR